MSSYDYRTYLSMPKDCSKLKEKLKSIHSTELQWYENTSVEIFRRKKLPNFSKDSIIEQIIPRSKSELNSRREKESYYLANAKAFIETIGWILSDSFIEQFVNEEFAQFNLTCYNYRELVNDLLYDSIWILKQTETIQGKTSQFLIDINFRQDEQESFQFLRQIIFGQSSMHAFIDRSPAISVLLLRQMIELRIKRACGVIGVQNRSNGAFEPFGLKLVFQAIEENESLIDLSIPLANLQRINSWANLFVHSGFRDYHWKPIVVLRYLWTFFTGKELSPHDWSVHYGISMKEEAISKIHKSIIEKMENNVELITCKPECHLY